MGGSSQRKGEACLWACETYMYDTCMLSVISSDNAPGFTTTYIWHNSNTDLGLSVSSYDSAPTH